MVNSSCACQYLVLMAADQSDAAVIWPVDVPDCSCRGSNNAHVKTLIKCCSDCRPVQHDLVLQHHFGPPEGQRGMDKAPSVMSWAVWEFCRLSSTIHILHSTAHFCYSQSKELLAGKPVYEAAIGKKSKTFDLFVAIQTKNIQVRYCFFQYECDMVSLSLANRFLPRKSQEKMTKFWENKHQTFGWYCRHFPVASQPAKLRPPTDATSVSCCPSTDDSPGTATLLCQLTNCHLKNRSNAGHTA